MRLNIPKSHFTTAKTPYKIRHGRWLLCHGCLSVPGAISTFVSHLCFPLFFLHLLLEDLHEATIVGESVTSRQRGLACRRRVTTQGSWAVAARVTTALAACLRFNMFSLWIHNRLYCQNPCLPQNYDYFQVELLWYSCCLTEPLSRPLVKLYRVQKNGSI